MGGVSLSECVRRRESTGTGDMREGLCLLLIALAAACAVASEVSPLDDSAETAIALGATSAPAGGAAAKDIASFVKKGAKKAKVAAQKAAAEKEFSAGFDKKEKKAEAPAKKKAAAPAKKAAAGKKAAAAPAKAGAKPCHHDGCFTGGGLAKDDSPKPVHKKGKKGCHHDGCFNGDGKKGKNHGIVKGNVGKDGTPHQKKKAKHPQHGQQGQQK